MKTFNYFSVLIITFTLLLTSCTQDNSADFDTQNKAFEIVPFTQGQGKNKLENYKVTNYAISGNQLDVEITVPTNDFSFVKAYNISTDKNSALLYLITRNSTEVVKDLPVNYLINDRVDVSEFNLDKNNLTIFVMNSTANYNNDSLIFDCIKNNMDAGIINGTTCTNESRTLDGPETCNGSIILR